MRSGGALLFALVAGAFIASPIWTATSPRPEDGAAAAARIRALAHGSQCAAYKWRDDAGGRGRAHVAYFEGLALVYARAVCHPERAEVKAVAGTDSPGKPEADSLKFFDPQFKAAGLMAGDAAKNSLRHTYTLLAGLGVRESSGRYCMGRYLKDPFNTADSAEAGPFQASWGASKKSPTSQPMLEALFAKYRADQHGCLLDVFSKGVSCNPAEAKNWGSGDGAEWQRLTKACPGFATEYAAVIARTHGGPNGEFGPIRKQTAEIRPECDSLFEQVEQEVRSHPGDCTGL